MHVAIVRWWRPVVTIVGAGMIFLYAWWATGRHPFTVSSYVAVGLPAVIALALTFFNSSRGVAADPSVESAAPNGARWPWLILLGAAVVLETLALVSGGRSTTVPTLSTVVDYALRWHASRLLLFSIWLAAGWSVVSAW